jgi:hypothetical protein
MSDRLTNIGGGRWNKNNHCGEMSVYEQKYDSRREDA